MEAKSIRRRSLERQAIAQTFPRELLASGSAFVEKIRNAGSLADIFAAAYQVVHEIVPDTCLSIWMWDRDKNLACLMYSNRPAVGHVEPSAQLGANSWVARIINEEGFAAEMQWIPGDSAESGASACQNSKGIAYLRMHTADKIPLLLTACVPKRLEGDHRIFNDFFLLLAHALVQSIDRIRLAREKKLLACIARPIEPGLHRREFFDQVAADLRDAFGARGCSIFVLDKNRNDLILGGTTGLYDSTLERKLSKEQENEVRYQRGEGLTGWIFERLLPVRMFNASNDEEWSQIDIRPNFEPFCKSAEGPVPSGVPRPFLGMPICDLEPRHLVGIVRLHGRTDGGYYLPSDENELHSISLELARSIKLWNAAIDARESLERQRTLFAVVGAMHAQENLDSVLATIAEETKELFGALAVTILLKVPRQDRLTVVVDKADRAKIAESIEIGYNEGLCGYAAKHRQVLLIPDVKQDERFCDLNHYQIGLLDDVRSEACVPILYRDECLGVLNIDSDRIGAFHPSDETTALLLEILAKQLAIAVRRQRDIQERERLQVEMEDRFKEYRALAWGRVLVHEFKEGLFLFGSRFSTLKQQIAGNSSAAETLEDLLQCLDALNVTIDALSESKPGNDRVISRICANTVVAGAQCLWAAKARAANVDVKCEQDSRLDSITIDTCLVEIRQALLQLVYNAIDASAANHTPVVVATRDSGNSVVIEVTDWAGGVSNDLVEKIWERQYSTKPNGWGMGLPLAKELVEEKNSGSLELVNPEIGSGCTFRITLPKSSHIGS